MSPADTFAPLSPLVDDEVSGPLTVVPFEVPGLGNRTYIASGDCYAVLVDPPRDVDSLLGFAADRGWTITHVVETHIHNDYVSGGLAVARRTGAEYVVPADTDVAFHARQITDGEEFAVGPGTMRAVHTPGHTPTSMSFLLRTSAGDVAVFTGGGLLYGGVGRTDLFGPDLAEGLARDQWASARKLESLSGPGAVVLPTHGFGSFCSVGDSDFGDRTIAGLKLTNPVFREEQDLFVDRLLGQQGPFPSYFDQMGSLNREGTPQADLARPVIETLAQIAARAEAGEWVLDLRHRHAFADAHLPHTLSFDAASAYVTYIGWLIPWGADVHVIVPDELLLRTAVIELARIGIESVRSAAFWKDGSLDTSAMDVFQHADGRRLRAALADDPVLPVLDVRLPSESSRARLAGEFAVPVHELAARMEEVRAWSAGRTVWVYCASGFRSAVAASMLERAGIPAVHVDGSVVDS